MSLPFTLGGIENLLVEVYDGFDRPNTAQLVGLLSDATGSGTDQVLQQGSMPYRQASVSGTLVEAADVALARDYFDSREVVLFTDGDGEAHQVRLLEFSARAYTGWWTFAMQLLEVEAGAS